jgi:hypothetical protein
MGLSTPIAIFPQFFKINFQKLPKRTPEVDFLLPSYQILFNNG